MKKLARRNERHSEAKNRGEEENFLEAILENIPDMIFVKEARELRFVRFNKAGEQLLGQSRQELLGKNDFDLFPKEQADFFTSNDRSVLRTGTLLDIAEENIQTLHGERILHTKKIPIYGPDGEPQYLVGISEDITIKKQVDEVRQKMYQEQVARKEMEKTLDMQEDFFSMVSHELKAPLATLKLRTEIELRDLISGKAQGKEREKLHELVLFSQKQMERLERLVEDMLDVSRIHGGKLRMNRCEFSMDELIRDILDKMKLQFEKMGSPNFISVSTDARGIWDKGRIEQVIVNLLTNVIRYGRGLPCEFHLESDENGVHFFIKDHGIGIEQENLEKIFQRFERGASHRETHGLGMGLFISKKIVEAHNGKIWAESVPGNGSTFHVWLPRIVQTT